MNRGKYTLETLRFDGIIEKRNILNEMKASQMSLQEVRFFSIYLSKINARDISTRVVDFALDDFVTLMEIQKVNILSIKKTLSSLLAKVIFVPSEEGGFSGFQLFKKCQVYQDKTTNRWRVKIDAHDEALPLMFDFKEKYFKYELWNAMSLTSTIQIRMYEILKQYEKIGERTIDLKTLKSLLGIDEKKYKRFNNFREFVIDRSQKALLENTDIYFEYTTITAKGRKVVAIQFKIYANANYKGNDEAKIVIKELENKDEKQNTNNNSAIDYALYAEMLDNEFSLNQVEFLYQLALPIVQSKYLNNKNNFAINMANYLRLVYKRLKAAPFEVKHPYGYIKKLISLDLETIEENR